MKLTITIHMDNAAFSDGNGGTEVARILGNWAHHVSGNPLEKGDRWNLRDINGNTVGEAKVTR